MKNKTVRKENVNIIIKYSYILFVMLVFIKSIKQREDISYNLLYSIVMDLWISRIYKKYIYFIIKASI